MLALVASCVSCAPAPVGIGTPITGPRAPAVCAGVACPAHQLCCYATSQCFDPVASPAACSVVGVDAGPPLTGTGIDSMRDGPEPPCASDADCFDGEYCASTAGFCTRAGFCAPRNNCGSCGPAGSPDCVVCGCDGVTYPSQQATCAAGARASAFTIGGACGDTRVRPFGDGGHAVAPTRVPCGNDGQCFVGMRCCPLYGYCVDPSCTWCCQPPPAGTRMPCGTNADCAGTNDTFCDGTGCGTPGGCVAPAASSDCGVEPDPVCGCDGRSYLNQCQAHSASVRVAHAGSCGDAGSP